MANVLKYCLILLLVSAALSCENAIEKEEVSELPVIRINTVGGESITSKSEYLPATIQIEGTQVFQSEVGVRGRGNTTWSFPKKPFKLKFDEKTSILGLEASKKWVLLANYLDPSLMHNAVAMEVGRLIEMPFSNHMIPVDLWVNNELLGNYTLTEQIEVKDERVNVENDGLLLSLDTIIDPDDVYFESDEFSLPVIIKNPEPSNDTQLSAIKNDFLEFEKKVADPAFPKNDYLDLFDAEVMAKYLVIYTLTCNEEINHPKSTYLHKKVGGKYTIGPIWDFDWAFSFEQSQVHYVNPNRPLFWDRNTKGTRFFKKIADDPAIQKLVKEEWERFREEHFDELLNFVEKYAESITDSRKADYRKWGRGEADFSVEVENLKHWLVKRGDFMDRLVADY